MKLKEYIQENEITPAEFGEQIGVSGQAVRNWIRGRAIPNKTQMPKIIRATGGKVTPASFFDVYIMGKVS